MNPHFVSDREGGDTILHVLSDCLLGPRPFWRNCSSGLSSCEDYTASFSVSLESRGEHDGLLACEWGAAARRCCELIKGLWGRRLFWRHLLRGSSGETGTLGTGTKARQLPRRLEENRQKGPSPRPQASPSTPGSPSTPFCSQKKRKSIPPTASCSCQLPYQLPREGLVCTRCKQTAKSMEGASGQTVYLPYTPLRGTERRAVGTPGPHCPPAWAGPGSGWGRSPGSPESTAEKPRETNTGWDAGIYPSRARGDG